LEFRGQCDSRALPPGQRDQERGRHRELRDALGKYENELYYAEHHESYAASAFFPSPFEEAAVITMGGVGK
jgi:predicted NodU family carbamoyl transferase